MDRRATVTEYEYNADVALVRVTRAGDRERVGGDVPRVGQLHPGHGRSRARTRGRRRTLLVRPDKDVARVYDSSARTSSGESHSVWGLESSSRRQARLGTASAASTSDVRLFLGGQPVADDPVPQRGKSGPRLCGRPGADCEEPVVGASGEVVSRASLGRTASIP